MIIQSKKQSLQTILSNKKVFILSAIYAITIVLLRIFPFAFSIDLSISIKFVGVCLTDFFTFPMLLGLTYCLLKNRVDIRSFLHFYYGRRLLTVIPLTLITLFINNIIEYLKTISNSNYYNIIIIAVGAFCIVVLNYLFVFEYYFAMYDSDVNNVFRKSFYIFKKHFIKIILFNLSFILWYIVPAIIIFIYEYVNAITDYQAWWIMLFLSQAVNVFYQPYYIKSKINFISFLENNENKIL